MVKNTVNYEYLNSDKTIKSWKDFMENEIKDSEENIVVDREEDF